MLFRSFRLLSSAPPLATYQYSGAARPFEFPVTVDWFETGETVEQVVEYLEADTQVSRDGEVVTKVIMMVKTRGRGVLKTQLPKDRSEEHTSELQSRTNLVCRLLLEKKKQQQQ